jgi:hypothetical protein
MVKINWKQWIVGGAGSAFTDTLEGVARQFAGGLPGGIFGINTAQLLVGILAAWAVDNHKVKGLTADFVSGVAITEFGNILAPFINGFGGLKIFAPTNSISSNPTPSRTGFDRMLAVR